MTQILLFEESLEGKLLREVRELKESVTKIRKGQFAKIGDLTKKYNLLLEDMEILKSNICRQSTSALHSNNEKILEMAAM
jgi:hypothetical protein